MEKFLDITPGSLSVLGLMNDKDNSVQLVIDEDILKGEFIEEAEPVLIEKKPKTQEHNTVYDRLLGSLDRLTRLVKSSKGRTNKDLAKLADKINEVCNKWE